MNRAWVYISILLIIFMFSCEDDEGFSCNSPSGEMLAIVNDSVAWDFRFITFRRWSETDFAEQWADSSISITSEFINMGCELELSLVFHNLAQISGQQNLIRPIYEENHPSQLQPHSVFYTWNIDALTEQFDLYEAEPAWIRLSEVTDERVTGTFQATYVYSPSALRFWDLPDTLRFNQVSFESELFVALVE